MVAQESKALRLAIDSSPLWDIDLEIRRPFFKAMRRKMLRDNDDEVVEIPTLSPENEKLCKTVWAQVMMLDGKTEPFIISVAFFQAAAAYVRNPEKENDSFCRYFITVLQRARAGEAVSEKQELLHISRESARKVRIALDYMSKYDLTENMVMQDQELLKIVAHAAGIGTKLLYDSLCNKNILISLDGEEDGDDTRKIQIGDPGQDIEGIFDNVQAFPLLHEAVMIMNLEEKEKYRTRAMYYWSPQILGYIRADEQPNIQERKARCADIRPMEKDGILWDVLLSRGYVGYTIREPLYQGMGPDNSSEIRAAALNPLVDPINRRPENDLTVANYLGKDNTTISKHNKKIREQFEELMKRNHCLNKSK